MPIVVTAIAVTTLFRGGSGNRGSFLDPGSIRKRVKNNERALAIVDEMEELERKYNKAAVASVEAYAAMAANHGSTADALIAQRRPADAAFMKGLEDLVRIRQSMLDTLTPEEWAKVFG